MNDTSSDNKVNNIEIPSLDIVDLDDTEKEAKISFEKTISDEFKSAYRNPKTSADSAKDKGDDNMAKKIFQKMNWHIAFLLVLLICIVFIVYRFANWGNRVNTHDFFHPDESYDIEAEIEPIDNILPHTMADGTEYVDDGIRTVVALGNAPFADDRSSEDNLASLISELSDATVYNCSVADSYLAASEATFDAGSEPMDAFNFYWLTTLMALDNTSIYDIAFAAMGEDTPADAREAYHTLTTLDFAAVDVITIMYDASDYLDGRPLYNPENSTDIQTFYGNLTAGIELLQEAFPHIRIIVMSPAYAYAIDANGDYASSELYLYNEEPLSEYVQLQEHAASSHAVSFLDHFYGTVNEINADNYLTDHLHLNLDGRKKVAERFVYALEYYD